MSAGFEAVFERGAQVRTVLIPAPESRCYRECQQPAGPIVEARPPPHRRPGIAGDPFIEFAGEIGGGGENRVHKRAAHHLTPHLITGRQHATVLESRKQECRQRRIESAGTVDIREMISRYLLCLSARNVTRQNVAVSRPGQGGILIASDYQRPRLNLAQPAAEIQIANRGAAARISPRMHANQIEAQPRIHAFHSALASQEKSSAPLSYRRSMPCRAPVQPCGARPTSRAAARTASCWPAPDE